MLKDREQRQILQHNGLASPAQGRSFVQLEHPSVQLGPAALV